MMALATVVNSQMMDEALLWLLEFKDIKNNVILRAVNNLEDITSGGNIYTAFPFTLTLPPQDQSKPQSLSLVFSNVSQDLVHMIREYAPGNHPQVKLMLVLASNPNSIEKTIDFMEIANVTYDALEITFELSSSSIFARKTCVATYNQIEFPGLFFALSGGSKTGSIPLPPITQDPDTQDPLPTTTIPSVSDFEDVFGQSLAVDGRTHYRDVLVEDRRMAIRITIPTLTKPALFVAEERSTGGGAKHGNLSDNQGFGPAGVLDERINVVVGVIASYTFPAGASRIVWLNLQQISLFDVRMLASLSITLKYQ